MNKDSNKDMNSKSNSDNQKTQFTKSEMDDIRKGIKSTYDDFDDIHPLEFGR